MHLGELQAVVGQLYSRGAAFIAERLGYTPANKAGDTFTGPVIAGFGASFGNIARAATDTLDWYEEGTFTPVVSGTTTAGAATYTRQQGEFTRIGNKVMFSIGLGWSAHTGTGNIVITGLPYTSRNFGGRGWACSVYYNGLAVGAGKELAVLLTPNSSQFNLYASDPGGAAAALVAMDTVVSELYISGVYEVA